MLDYYLFKQGLVIQFAFAKAALGNPFHGRNAHGNNARRDDFSFAILGIENDHRQECLVAGRVDSANMQALVVEEGEPDGLHDCGDNSVT
jgi:hypothetical protein